MKRLFSLISLLLLYNGHLFAAWPTNGPAFVTANFGTFEGNANGSDEGVFHSGLDIPQIGASSKCIAVADLKVIKFFLDSDLGNTFQGVLFENINNPGQYIMYYHIEELPNGPDLRTSGSVITTGQAFAVIRDTTSARTTFPHTHFLVASDPDDWAYTAINPLTSGLITPADPAGAYPQIGPVYLKRGNNYINSDDPAYPYLWGKIDIIAQITDFMGHNVDNPGGDISDRDVFQSTAPRYNGITSTPYKVEYSILDSLGNVVKQPESYTFSGNPDDTKMATLYEADKQVNENISGGTLPYNYSFNLTNVVDDRYWNTKLSTNVAWNGGDAKIDGANSGSIYRAQYPDGKYTIKISAWDVEKSSDSFTAVIVDNFRPFLEQVEVKKVSGENEYLRAWSFYGSDLTSTSPASILLGAGAHALNLRFSEPVSTAALSLDTPETTPDLADSGDHQGFTATITAGEGAFTRDGDYLLTVQAQDLAGNYLLALTPEKRTITPATELTRDASGQMQGNPLGALGDVLALTIDRTTPTITVLDNAGELGEGAVSDGASGIWIEVDDFGPDFEPLYGSGLSRLEVYSRNPDGTDVLIASNTETHDAGFIYTSDDNGLDWLADLPESTITVRAYDRAGNFSNSSFIIRRPPHADLQAGESSIYFDAWGVMTSTPSTLGRTYALSAAAGNSGVASIKVTGPVSGLPDMGFSPPVASTGAFFSLSTPGDYVLTIVDGQGGRTVLPFNFGELSVSVSTPESAGNIQYPTDYYAPGSAAAVLKCAMHASNGLDHVEFLAPDGKLLQTTPLNGVMDDTVTLNTGSLAFTWGESNPPFPNILARVYDKHPIRT